MQKYKNFGKSENTYEKLKELNINNNKISNVDFLNKVNFIELNTINHEKVAPINA